MFYDIYLYTLCYYICCLLGACMRCTRLCSLKPGVTWGKERYHNNFGCYSFVARSGSICLVPTFRKRWPGDWMKEWFYVKNDLRAREDIKEIIMCPIWSRFGLRKPKVEIDEAAEECRRAFGIICSFIGTRDLVQEHVAYRIWPLVVNWEMPKETISNPNEGGLVRLKYTFRFEDHLSNQTTTG
jgi:hypothetical protein